MDAREARDRILGIIEGATADAVADETERMRKAAVRCALLLRARAGMTNENTREALRAAGVYSFESDAALIQWARRRGISSDGGLEACGLATTGAREGILPAAD
jgi:hypothetical protein